MNKKILSEIALFEGEITLPKNYQVDRYKIKSDILQSKLDNKTVSSNPYAFAFCDYNIETSAPLNLVRSTIAEKLNVYHQIGIEPRLSFGNVFDPKQQSFFRNMIDPVNIKESPDYVMIYGVDVDKNASVVIENKDKRGIDQLSVYPIANNHFVIFPAYLRFFMNENDSSQTNIFLTTTYVKI
tara:strand:- start:1355 stop:1903 length:549 start_codon:yes stop_codon:yes gene_type:complete